MLQIFKSAKRLQAERNAAYLAKAVERERTFVREAPDLTDPAAPVHVVADLHTPHWYHSGGTGRRLDLNSSGYLNGGQFGDAHGVWKVDFDGCNVLVVTGAAKNVAAWLAAYDR